MDPSACFQMFLDAELYEEKREHAENLLHWLNRGGFAPDWDATQRAQFFVWCNDNNVRGEW